MEEDRPKEQHETQPQAETEREKQAKETAKKKQSAAASKKAHMQKKAERRQKKKQQRDAQADAEISRSDKKARLRTSQDVYNRITWDDAWADKRSDLVIGYLDRFDGLMEIGLTEFVPTDKGGDIAWHRIYHFREGDHFLWDRNKRIDRVFGSGDTAELDAAEAAAAAAAAAEAAAAEAASAAETAAADDEDGTSSSNASDSGDDDDDDAYFDVQE